MGRTTRTLSRLLVVGIVASTTIIGLTGTSWAAGRTHAAEEVSFSRKINASRQNAGLGRLTVNLALTGVARNWSDQMAADGQISHNPQVAGQVAGDWTRLGENVGFSSRSGTTGAEFVDRLHTAFMNSPGHRANIMGDFNQVGVGVRMTCDTMWVTVNFMKADTVVSNRTVSEATSVAGRVFVAPGQAGRHADYVVLTASDQSSHAMGGAALAGGRGPLLYTHPARKWDPSPVLHPQTRAEIDRVLGGRGVVYAIGGTSDISERAARELVNDGYTVRRLAASSTPATLVKVANETIRRRGNNGRVVIGRVGDWGSTSAAAGWAATTGTPVLLTGGDRLHPRVRDFLANRRPARRWVLGPRRSISLSVQNAANARRITGDTRSGMSVKVAKTLWNRTDASDGDRWASTPGYARSGWAYTLAHASWSSVNAGPALLMRGSKVPASVANYLQRLDYGGGIQGHVRAASPVPQSVVNRVENLVAAN